MKKAISILLCTVMLLSVLATANLSALATLSENTVISVFDSESAASQILLGDGSVAILYGDLDGNGSVTSKDSIIMKKYLLGNISNINTAAADLNGDGRITAKDSFILKKVLQSGGSSSTVVPDSSAGETALYDATENAAYVTAASTSVKARFVPEALAEGFAADSYRYAGIVYKAVSSAQKGAVYALSQEPVKTEYTVYSDGEYHLKLVDLSENDGWTGDVEAIAFDLLSDCAAGDTVYIDSFILTNSLDTLEKTASDRVQVRCCPDLQVANSSGSAESSDTYSIVFNNSESYSLLCNPYNATYELNKYANCLEFTVDTGKIDPQVYLDLSSLGLSADEYKYVVYTYKLRTGSSLERKGEIFFCAGDVAVPTGGCSYGFTMTTDGNLHAVTIDASSLKNSYNQTYWKGDIHGMRLDFFQDAAVGEAVFVKSVVLCKTAAAAQNAASMMTGAVTSAADAKSILDCFVETCPVDTTGTLYMTENEASDKLLCLTGGTKDSFTKEKFETRLANETLKTTGMTTSVTVLDGFDEIKASYDSTEKALGYVTYMLSTGSDFYVKFIKVQYNMKKVIFDHDLGPDCDDAGAVSIVAKAHRAGEINCLAITTCINEEFSAYAAAAITDYLGCDDIAIGWNNERIATGMNVRCCKVPASNYWNTHGPWPVIYPNTSLLREILAENGNKKDITFISTGPITTLYCLFVSGADSVSELTGRELFVNNVSWYMCGGGNFVNTGETEHNFTEDIEATLYVINNLPEVRMTFAGSNVAGHIYTGSVLASCPDAWVVKGCYYYQNYQTGNYARNSWDLATVYFGVYGGAGMWQEKSGYNISAYTNGATIITEGGTSGYIEAIASDDVVRGAFHRGMVPD